MRLGCHAPRRGRAGAAAGARLAAVFLARSDCRRRPRTPRAHAADRGLAAGAGLRRRARQGRRRACSSSPHGRTAGVVPLRRAYQAWADNAIAPAIVKAIYFVEAAGSGSARDAAVLRVWNPQTHTFDDTRLARRTGNIRLRFTQRRSPRRASRSAAPAAAADAAASAASSACCSRRCRSATSSRSSCR